MPLIAASWSGEFRPYLYDGDRYRPLISDPRGRLARVDLYRPIPISSREILMTGQTAGRPFFDIYLLALGDDLPVNLTRTPELDEGDLCARPGSRLLAYRAGDREVFARLGRGLEPIASPVRGFDECAWLDQRHLVGIAGRAPPLALFECVAGTTSVECRELPGALRGIDRVTDLVPGGDGIAYLTALGRGHRFRTVFEIRAGRDPTPVAHPGGEGDLLDWSPGMWRMGHEGRYLSSLAPASTATLFKTRRIGERVFAIAADATTPRTLALLEAGEWALRPHEARPEAPAVREVWTRSTDGERHQSFHFGPASSKVVVWLHGGPRESVSPRFNPYYHALGRLGFAVMAVNYPGSTGRGAAYEESYADDVALERALRSVWDHLRRERVSTVVTWSVSAGSRLQRVLLARGFPISAIVDQAGFDNRDLVSMAARASVPLFSIRGRHDRFGPDTRVDHLYEGGHDITHPADFADLFAAVPAFLESAPPVEWP